MRVGVPKEIKPDEHRVGLVPGSVRELVRAGQEVLVETGAGAGIGATDAEYRRAGAEIVAGAAELYAAADMVVKVKEPQAAERAWLRPGQVLFAYLHLAPDPDQTRDLVESGAICIAYETVTAPGGGLPLLAPMSEVAGRMSIQVGAVTLEKAYGGRGVLLGGVPGVPPAKVVVLGGGMVGSNAVTMAVGLGADVTVIDRSMPVLRAISARFGPALKTVYSTATAIDEAVIDADLVIGGVLVPGGAAPKLVTREMLKHMKDGAVIVDVAIDQGGCFETSRPTTHRDPTYVVDGVVHYCVANMPGAVPRTSSYALNNATLPFVLDLAAKGWRRALSEDPHLLAGLNVAEGRVTYPAVAHDLHYPYTDPKLVLGS